MMDNMAPFMFGVAAFLVALVVTIIGMALTRRYLAWLWAGVMIFYLLWWILLGYPSFPTNGPVLIGQRAEGRLINLRIKSLMAPTDPDDADFMHNTSPYIFIRRPPHGRQMAAMVTYT